MGCHTLKTIKSSIIINMLVTYSFSFSYKFNLHFCSMKMAPGPSSISRFQLVWAVIALQEEKLSLPDSSLSLGRVLECVQALLMCPFQ